LIEVAPRARFGHVTGGEGKELPKGSDSRRHGRRSPVAGRLTDWGLMQRDLLFV
jgi:hypothetical protein